MWARGGVPSVYVCLHEFHIYIQYMKFREESLVILFSYLGQ